jgi:cytochrome oxidase Cu insertion factor (SCO1/SenC/PrrC family)
VGTPEKPATQEASASYFPNLVLLTQDNKPVHFYDELLKGKVVLINFLFTTCKGVCSPMTANLARVQKYLGERVGREVVMISLSVDPQTDTPAVLKKYADQFHAQPGWYFLTGDKKNVDWVLYKLGGYTADKEQHSAVLIIGNEATGEWMKVHAMSSPTEIASAVTKLLASKKETN